MTDDKRFNSTTIILGVAVIIIIVLAVAVLTLVSKQQSDFQTKTVAVPAEIKNQSEAVSLEKDTSSILKEVG